MYVCMYVCMYVFMYVCPEWFYLIAVKGHDNGLARVENSYGKTYVD